MNMAIKIQTEKPHIPIEFGNLNFKFDLTDESIKAYRENHSKLQKDLEGINIDEDDEAAIEQVRDLLERGYDLTLGKGAFAKIYKEVPSVILLLNYFEQLMNGIGEELKKRGFKPSAQEKARKYLANKKK